MTKSNQKFGARRTTFATAPTPKSRSKKPFFLYVIFTLLIASNVALALTLSMLPEFTQLFVKKDDTVLAAYETRILHLRMEVDRLHSRQYLEAGNLNLQLQELLQQQQILTEQHQYIRVLAQKAQDLGITTASMDVNEAGLDPAITGSLFQRTAPQLTMQGSLVEAQDVKNSLIAMMQESTTVLTSISSSATHSTDTILGHLKNVGIVPQLTDLDSPAVGGPLLALDSDAQSSSLYHEANLTLNSLERFTQARAALNSAPVHFPLGSHTRISSSFGSRNDPFGGSRAFHSGIDYPAPTGTKVFSAGDGKVIFAGRRSGYGNLIEVDHGGGIITRYGHLSAILVQTGQNITAGFAIGKVGSTGRSTGPHLHFEIRRNQSAVNPASFLAVSKELHEFIG